MTAMIANRMTDIAAAFPIRWNWNAVW